MSAMERIGSYIRSGVYNVAAPFHPFGGAVDIIVIEQQDGTFKSSPWYVKFGKFQGVLKRKEKLVSISVNGAAADFTMFLDHKGEAYFLRESVSNDGDEEEETGSTALSSGEDSESGSRGKKVDQRGFNSDDDHRRLPGDEAAVVVRSDSKRIPWLSFGRRSIKNEGKDGSVDRVSSMERAQIVSDLLDTKWSMNLPSGRRKGAREASPSDSSSIGISKFGSSGAVSENSTRGSLSLEDAVTVNSMEPREVGASTSGRETETSLIASAISEKSSIENALLLRDAVDAVAETVLDSTVPADDGMNSPVAVSNLANSGAGSSAVSSELVYIAAEHSELNEKSDEAVEEASSLLEGVSVVAAAARIDIQEDAVADVVERTMQVSSSESAALDGSALTDAHLLVSDELMLKQHTCSETRHDESGKVNDSCSGHTDSFNNNNSVISEHTPVLEQNSIVSEHVELETSCHASGPPESTPSTLDTGYFACERETTQLPDAEDYGPSEPEGNDTAQQNESSIRTCEDVSGLPCELLHNKDELASFSDTRCEPLVAADQAIQKDDVELHQIEVANSNAATIPDEEKLIVRKRSFADSSSQLHFVPGSSSNPSSHACHGVCDPSKFDTEKEDARNNSVSLGSSSETQTDQNRSKQLVECDSLEGDVFQMDDISEMDNTETGKVQENNVEEDKILENRIEAVDDGAVSTNSSRFELREEIQMIDSSRYITSAKPDTENEINALAHVSEDVRFQENKDLGSLALNDANKILDIESLVVAGISTTIESDYHRVFLSENGNTTDPVGPVGEVAFKEFELSLNNGDAIIEPAEPVLEVAHKEFESSVMHRQSSSSSDSLLVFNSRANETSTSCACGGSTLNEAENSQPMNVSKGHKDDSENTLLSKSLPIIKTGISYPESFDSRGIRTVGSNYELLKYEALSKAFQRSPPGSVLSRTGESDKPSARHAPDPTGSSENKDQNSLERLPGFPDVEVSLCKHLLREGMGIEAASKAFDSNKVSLTQFSSLGQSIIKNDKLTVRIDGRYYPWDAAAPILLGMATFGPGRTIKSKGMIAVEKVEDALVKYPSLSWRLWPFARRSKTFGHTRSLPYGSIVDAAKDPLELSLDGTSESSVSRRGIKKERSLIPTSEQLASLNLKEGRNIITFAFSTAMLGKQEVDARIYRWKWDTKIVISDVDGTITKSDVLGQVMPLVGRDWSQTGAAHLFSAIKENGYQVMFLSARAISQAYLTRQFLGNLKQDGKALPDGPVVISPDGLFPSLFREVVRRAPHEFKIACLEDIRALFPSDVSPFYAGFGNRDTDEISYLKVGIPKGEIFIINPRVHCCAYTGWRRARG